MNFHGTIRPILLILQLFGQFPLYGILRSDPARWRFRWCSPQTVFCLVLMHFGLFLCYIEYERLSAVGVNADNVLGPLFYVNVVVIMVLLLRVAHKWPSVVGKFGEVEALETLLYNGLKHNRQAARRIRAVALSLIISGLAEHILAVGKTLYAKIDEGRVCQWKYSNLPEYYALRTYGFFFRLVPYNFPTFVFLEYANTALTMAWIAQDVLIIMICDAIAGYFERLNGRVQFYSTLQVVARETFWCDIHAHYVLVCELLEQVMTITSPLLLVSCGTNLYLICYQLFHIMETKNILFDTLFTYFSLSVVLLRTFLTMNYCSAVHEVTRKPSKMCRRIPSTHWCSELQRFYDMIRKKSIVVSAMGLFNLTRRTMLTMLGAVITYELVMLHFAKTTATQGIVQLCSSSEFSYQPKLDDGSA